MRSILTDLGGFTPVLDVVTQDVGHTTSLVYGLVWRHCQMRDGVCKRSVEELAAMVEMSDRTMRRHLKRLVERGYIKDLTPDLRNRPHVYADAGKVKISGKIEATLTETHSDNLSYQDNHGMTNCQSHYDNLSGQVGKNVIATMTKSPMSNTKETIEKTRERVAPPNSDDLSWQAVLAYTEITGLKLDRIQGKAIIKLVEETPDFDLARWRMTCTTVKLGGVLPGNIACRIDTYKAGGNYQAMKERQRNGQPETPTSKPITLDPDKLAIARALNEEMQRNKAETETSISAIFDGGIKAAGVDVEKEIKKVQRRLK